MQALGEARLFCALEENWVCICTIDFKSNEIELSVKVSPNEDTVWLTKEQMAVLFDRDRSVISKHIKNVFLENELDEKSNVHFLHVTNSDKPVQHFSLDVVISVGYRVKSPNGILFRKWSNTVLKEYLLKGYAINENRTLITNENYINLINRVDSIDNRLQKFEGYIENQKLEKLIVDGELFDATTFLESLVAKAKNIVLLADSYADSRALDILKYSRDNVIIKIVTSKKSKLSRLDIDSFNKQYHQNILVTIDSNFHDRYLFIDDKVYHLGASINNIGMKLSQIDEVEDELHKKYLRERVDL